MSGILLAFSGGSYGSPPANTVAPAVTGTAQVRQTLSCSTGTWDGVPAPTFTYQWQSNSSNISGATSNTYQIVDAYVGTVIRCVVTATNPISTASANSNATASVTANVPAAPTIGTATATSSTTASITFSAPTGSLATGGSAITGYTMYSSGGQTATGSSSPITITGLTSETSYNFYVRANNAIGQSANSGTSNTITTSVAYWMAFLDNNWSGANALPSLSNSSGVTSVIGGGGYGNTPATRLTKDGAVSSSAYTSSNNSVYPSGNGNMNGGNWAMSGWSSGDGSEVYGGGYNYPNSFAAISKVNASGTIQWFRTYNWGGGLYGPVQTIQQGEDGFIYACGHLGSREGAYGIKLNTSGTTQFVARGGANGGGQSMTGDGSSIYYSAWYDVSGSLQCAYLYSYNTSWTTRNWTRIVEPFTRPDQNSLSIRYLETYGGNLYGIGTIGEFSSGGIGQAAIIVKFNSSGTIQWSRYVKCNGNSNLGVMLHVDRSTGYIYAVGQDGNTSTQWITKFDANATVAWQRKIQASSGSGTVNKASTVSVTGNTMYWSLTYNVPNYAALMIKLPTDGSKTGSYVGYNSTTYTYASFSDWNDASGKVRVTTSTTGVSTSSPTEGTTGNVAGAMSTARSFLTNIP